MYFSFHKNVLPLLLLFSSLTFSLLVFSCAGTPDKSSAEPEYEEWRRQPEVISSYPVEWKDVKLLCEGNFKNKGSISYPAFLSDLKTLRYLIESAYIGYEKAVEKGLNLNQCMDNLKKRFSDQTEIKTKEFYDAIYEELSPYIKDNHFFIYNFIYRTQLCSHENIYFSDIFVKKEGDSFSKAFDDSFNIPKGSIYTGSKENLFYYPVKGKDIYRIGEKSEHAVFSMQTSFSGTLAEVPVKSDSAIETKKNFITGKRTSAKTAYISLSSFVLPQENDTRRKAAEIMIDRLWNYIEESHEKENIIIDLRSNGGGLISLSLDFADRLLCGKDYFIERTPDMELDVFTTETLTSPPILQAIYMTGKKLGVNSEDYTNYLLQTIDSYKKHPRRERKCEDFFNKVYISGNPVKDRYQNKIFVLADRNSGSSAELFYIFLKSTADNPERIKLVGENTCGRMENVAIWEYILPESGIILGLSSQTYSPTLSRVPAWQGEGRGLYPDYWCRGEDLLETLVTLTGDEELREALEGLYEGLLL